MVAQIFDRDLHSSQGFPDPGDVGLEDDRIFFPLTREQSIDVRSGERCRVKRVLFIIRFAGRRRYYVEKVDFLETTGA